MKTSDHLAKAQAALRSGRKSDAASALRAALQSDPQEPVALNMLANLELAAGHVTSARELFQRAVANDPRQPALLFNLAAALRAEGNVAGALDALKSSLEIDPYFVQAMFQMGVIYDESGDGKSAAHIFRNLLDTAPPEILNDTRFAGPLKRARETVKRDADQLGITMERVVRESTPRSREAVDILLGRSQHYVSKPTFLTIPRLPAVSFLDRDHFPWLDMLEAATSDILAEAEKVMAGGQQATFVPYVANPPGVPANQWQELDHSTDWGAFFLIKHGQRHEENCAKCPATARALDAVSQIELEGRAPNAFYSRLAARTHIPPHTGVTNARLTCHLPLIVPKGCRFRVGSETREWIAGQAWVFDDTIEHEAWNDSDEPRLILLFDVWHPMLDEGEQRTIRSVFQAYDDHYGARMGLTDTL